MRVGFKYFHLVCIILMGTIGCQQKTKSVYGKTISLNQRDIQEGEKLFAKYCSACHNFKNVGIGPNLNGITNNVPTKWIKDFITNPTLMLEKGDKRALELFEKYPSPMPKFDYLESEELESLLAYMHTFNDTTLEDSPNISALSDPIEDTLQFTPLIAELTFLAQVPASSESSPLARINKIACETGNGRLFINDLRGILYEVRKNNIVPYMSLKDLEPNFIDEPGLGTGFGSFAFHPNFIENGLLYTTHSEPSLTKKADFTYNDSISKGIQWVLKEWKISDINSNIFSGEGREIMRVDFFGTIHGMQEIAFNKTAEISSKDYGNLYICLGDGASTENGFKEISYHNGQKIWSSILRIDPLGTNSSNGAYGIPNDNPFKNQKGFAEEIWAYGFRNPNKLSWDKAGNLYTSDIGHNQIEEINLVEPGGFYGWPIREGTFVLNPDKRMDEIFPLPVKDTIYNVSYPLIQYDHSEGAAVSGGYNVLNGIFKDKYIFGDIPTGNVYLSDFNTNSLNKLKVSIKDSIKTFKELTGSNRVDLRFGQGCNGTFYFFTKADGKIYVLSN